jgi:hypothetical protein
MSRFDVWRGSGTVKMASFLREVGRDVRMSIERHPASLRIRQDVGKTP